MVWMTTLPVDIKSCRNALPAERVLSSYRHRNTGVAHQERREGLNPIDRCRVNPYGAKATQRMIACRERFPPSIYLLFGPALSFHHRHCPGPGH